MEICFRSKAVYAVRFFDRAEKNQLLDTVETLGICVSEKYRQDAFSWPGELLNPAVCEIIDPIIRFIIFVSFFKKTLLLKKSF